MIFVKIDGHTLKNKNQSVSLYIKLKFKWIESLNLKSDGLNVIKENGQYKINFFPKNTVF